MADSEESYASEVEQDHNDEETQLLTPEVKVFECLPTGSILLLIFKIYICFDLFIIILISGNLTKYISIATKILSQ